MRTTDDRKRLLVDTAVVDVGALEVIRASGRDRVTFLQRLVTGDVAGTAEGAGSRSLLLTVKGHVVADLRIFVRADELLERRQVVGVVDRRDERVVVGVVQRRRERVGVHRDRSSAGVPEGGDDVHALSCAGEEDRGHGERA